MSGRYFTASHETLIWARKGEKTKHTFNYQAMKNGNHHERDVIKKDGKQMRSVWSITTPRPKEKVFGKHPTQKPLALVERCIQAASDIGDLVFDPFMGSGTTGIAALRNGRNFCGCEMKTDYFDLAIERLKNGI